MRYDFSSEFKGLKTKEIVVGAIGQQQRRLLQGWMGVGSSGARAALGRPLPAGLEEKTLRAYHEIARRMVSRGNDPRGTQAARIDLIESALDQLRRASGEEDTDS